MSRVFFTEHALKQFVARHKAANMGTVKHPEKTARKILAEAKEDDVLDDVARVRRLISNNFEEVSYFLNSGWRFVIKERDNKLFVLTIERDLGRYGGRK